MSHDLTTTMLHLSCATTVLGCLGVLVSTIGYCITRHKRWLRSAIISLVAPILVFGAYAAVLFNKDVSPIPSEATTGVLTDDGALQMFPDADWGKPKIAQNPNASFSRGNVFKDQSCWVYPLQKDDPPLALQDVLDDFLTKISSHLTSQEPVVHLTIDGYPALQVQYDIVAEGKAISQLMTIIETPNHFYRIAMSTKAPNKAAAMPIFQKVVVRTKVLKP